MQMQIHCTQCEAKLHVEESLVGSEVRCPKCEYIIPVQHEAVELDAETQGKPLSLETTPRSAAVETEWYLRIPEGRVYGPVRERILDQWVSEGRVSHDCELRGDDGSENDWHNADSKYPILREEGNPFRTKRSTDVPQRVNPHRGQLVFSLAIAGCFVPFLSIWPAILGTRDLRQMNLGKMDAAGDVLTRAGQAIAMVSSMIWVGAFGIVMLVLLIDFFGAP